MIKKCSVCCGRFKSSHHNAKVCSEKCRVEKNRAKSRKWAKDNPIRHRSAALAWRDRNPDLDRALCREWHRKNREKSQSNSQKQNAKRRLATEIFREVTGMTVDRSIAAMAIKHLDPTLLGELVND